MFPTVFCTGVGGTVASFRAVGDAPKIVRHRTISALADKTDAASRRVPAAKVMPIVTPGTNPINICHNIAPAQESVGRPNLGLTSRAKRPRLLAKAAQGRKSR